MAFDFSKVLSRTNGTKRRGNLNNMYGKTVSPDTLSRLWRSLREEYSDDKNNSTLHRNGISVIETKVNGSVQKHYQIGFSDGNGRY